MNLRFRDMSLRHKLGGLDTELSLWDVLYNLMLGPEVAALYASVFWPSFILRNDHVFLEEQFFEDGYQEWLVGVGSDKIEASLNTVVLSEQFKGGGDEANADETWLEVANAVAAAWRACAKATFPDRDFVTKVFWQSELDLAVTLTQRRHEHVLAEPDFQDWPLPEQTED